MFIKAILEPNEVEKALEEMMHYFLQYRLTEQEIEGYCRKIYRRRNEVGLGSKDPITLRLEIREKGEKGALFFLAILEPRSGKYYPIDKLEGFYKGDENVGREDSKLASGILPVPGFEVATKPIPSGWNRSNSAIQLPKSGYAYDPKRLPEFGPARRAKIPMGQRQPDGTISPTRGEFETLKRDPRKTGSKSDRPKDVRPDLFR